MKLHKKPILITILITIIISCNIVLLTSCSGIGEQDTNNIEDIDKDKVDEDLDIEDQDKEDQNDKDTKKDNKKEKEAVAKVVEEFGKKLQNVSLLANKDEVEKSMRENYGDLVMEEILKEWIHEPINAPGRLTSSPWPDRIEIREITKLSDDIYQVKGDIIEITSDKKEGAAAKRSIALLVKEIDDRWLIDDVTLGSYNETDQNIYENKEYGFRFTLPESWKGYSIVTDKWEGLSEDQKKVESGPIISIRHPKWTSKDPRQDIPTMIFTLGQWDALQKEQFHIGAAPIGPSELVRNSKYVFALPARYNYAFPTGYEEVEDILKSNPIQPIEDFN